MHEKVKYIFAQKLKTKQINSSTNKSSSPDSLQHKFYYRNIYNQHNQQISSLHLISCSFSLMVTFATFSNSFFKICEPFLPEFFELSRSFLKALWFVYFTLYNIKIVQGNYPMLCCPVKKVTGNFLMLYCAVKIAGGICLWFTAP